MPSVCVTIIKVEKMEKNKNTNNQYLLIIFRKTLFLAIGRYPMIVSTRTLKAAIAKHHLLGNVLCTKYSHIKRCGHYLRRREITCVTKM